ncbi:MAG: Uma2 family endonuclease [Myxococcales bacterium]|nr:Uma2 family endonuclease [Myxococcales bacterium]
MEGRDLRRVTVDEYVALDRASDERWEYVNGEAFAMAGGTVENVLVGKNVALALTGALRGKPCVAFGEGLKVSTPRTRAYHYPDVVVVCGPVRRDERDDHAVLNPTLIVEVLSPSTADYDRGGKLVHYRSLESFTDYLLVSIDDRSVEHHHRIEPGRSLLRTDVREGEIELEALDVTLRVDELWIDLDRVAEG